LCVKYYSPSKEDFLFSEGRICPSGFRRCGQTLSEFLCIKETNNCPINDFFITTDTTITPQQVLDNPNMFYHVFDLRDGGGRVFYTKDNPDGRILSEDFEFAFEGICMDKTEKTVDESLFENIFNHYKYVKFYAQCPDEVNKFLRNGQYNKGNFL
jgi:hypothetical protein